MTTVSTQTYTRSHTSVYVSEKLRNLVKTLLHHCGFNGLSAVDAMSDMEVNAVRTWLESGHLYCVVVEFYYPGNGDALARWDIQIRYDGNGGADMWVDHQFFEDSFAKAQAPPIGCSRRLVYLNHPNYPKVPGFVSATLRSTNGMVGRETGTVIGTPDIMASARYYRK